MYNIYDHLKIITSGKSWNYTITALIIINVVVLGMETYPSLMMTHGNLLIAIDNFILYVFVIELIIRLIAYRLDFFKNPWSIFDLCVVGIAIIPSSSAFTALRAARALRALRLVSIFPRLRAVIEGLVNAIPGIAAIGAVMAIVLSVFGLIASELYGAEFPQWFGNLHLALFSLFQIMTLEGWPDIVRTVMQVKPYAWIFFVTYILIATFSVLNLFIAVIVEAMQKNSDEKADSTKVEIETISRKLDLIMKELGLDQAKNNPK